MSENIFLLTYTDLDMGTILAALDSEDKAREYLKKYNPNNEEGYLIQVLSLNPTEDLLTKWPKDIFLAN